MWGCVRTGAEKYIWTQEEETTGGWRKLHIVRFQVLTAASKSDTVLDYLAVYPRRL
jgi:hypothetical protein